MQKTAYLYLGNSELKYMYAKEAESERSQGQVRIECGVTPSPDVDVAVTREDISIPVLVPVGSLVTTRILSEMDRLQ